MYNDNEIHIDMDKVNLLIAKRINNERMKKKLSIGQLSRLSGVDASHINRVEMGTRNLSFNAGIRLCIALEINLNDLYMIGEEKEDSISNRLGKIQDIIHTLSKQEFNEILNVIQETVNNLHNE